MVEWVMPEGVGGVPRYERQHEEISTREQEGDKSN